MPPVMEPEGVPVGSGAAEGVDPGAGTGSEPGPGPLYPPAHLRAAAEQVFAERVGTATRFASLLAGAGVLRGLLGPREVDRIWDRHLLNCAVLGELVPAGARVVDVGSGAGLPGLALALARPDLDLVLVEPLLRRSEFLEEAVASLNLRGTRVVRARAEELLEAELFGDGRAADVVTARAVAPLARLAAWCLPLLRPGGTMLALKGEGGKAEVTEAEAMLARLGARRWEVRVTGVGVLSEPSTVVRVELADKAVPVALARRLQREVARARKARK